MALLQHPDAQLAQPIRLYVDLPGHEPHATHGLFRADAACRGDTAAEGTQLTSTNNINAFVKITEHLYSIFARNINKKGWSLERGVYLPCIFILGLVACERRKSKEKKR